MTSIRALIFDLDDTLVSTAPAWRAAEIILLKAINIVKVDEELLASLNGRSAQDVVKIIHSRFESNLSREACQTYFESALLNAVSDGLVLEKPGARELVSWAHAKHRLAVASGSPAGVIHCVLKRFGLAGHFECVVSSEEVDEGKPSPKVFLEAAQRLELRPAECLVLEDSLVGVQAARAAGMLCYAVPSRLNESPEITALAHRTFQSLAEVVPAIERLATDGSGNTP